MHFCFALDIPWSGRGLWAAGIDGKGDIPLRFDLSQGRSYQNLDTEQELVHQRRREAPGQESHPAWRHKFRGTPAGRHPKWDR